jgi:ribose-phosphate pyrophosphokinase
MSDSLTLFAGTANPDLAMAIARELGVSLGDCAIEQFPDGEVFVRLNEPVRGHEIFIVQPTSPPVNEHLVELLALVDACRRASAAQITAIVPYFGYARSDKRHGRREPITASMVALLLQAVGVEHVVTIDLHAPQIEGFFHIPVDTLTAVPMLAAALVGRLPDGIVIAASDANAVRLASRYAHRLKTSVVVLHKQRESGTETKVTHLVGDVRDRPCLIVDDMISTGGTIAEAIEALLESGARPEITVAATHGLLLAGAREKLSHEAVRELLVTDTVPVAMDGWPQLRVISVAPLLARALKRLMADGSLSDLY